MESRKRLFNSGVGIMQDSLLPNHLYRYRAIILYPQSLTGFGKIQKNKSKFAGKERWPEIFKAAVDRSEILVPSQ